MLAFLAIMLGTFGAVFLKIFQQKNVIGGHKLAMCLTSYGIALFDVTVITMIVHTGWIAIPASGTGGALAALFAVQLHDKLFKRG